MSHAALSRAVQAAALVVAVALACCPAAFASGGALDPSFGRGGVKVVSVGIDDNYAQLLADGTRLLLVGESTATRSSESDVGVARLLANGALDTTYSGDGRLVFSVDPGVDLARDAVLQPDGKLLVAGTSGTTGRTMLARRNTNGSPDTAFGGGDGGVVADLVAQAYESIHGIALLADGRIIVAGYVEDDSGNGRGSVLVARFLADGSLDTSFAVGGVLRFNRSATSVDLVFDIAVLPSGKLLLAGSSADDRRSGTTRFLAVRLLPSGATDPTFGLGNGAVSHLAAQGDGLVTPAIALNPLLATFVLAATVDVPGMSSFTTLRLNADGSTDPTFVRRSDPGNSGLPRTAHLFDDGSVVAATSNDSRGEFDLAVQRVLASGRADTCFDRGGVALVDGLPGRGLDFDFGSSLLVAADGSLYVAGSTLGSAFSDFVVARLRGANAPGTCTRVNLAPRLRSRPGNPRLRHCGASRRRACAVRRNAVQAIQVDLNAAAALGVDAPIMLHLLRKTPAENFELRRTARLTTHVSTGTASARAVHALRAGTLARGLWQVRASRAATGDAQRGAGRTLWLRVS